MKTNTTAAPNRCASCKYFRREQNRYSRSGYCDKGMYDYPEKYGGGKIPIGCNTKACAEYSPR